MERPEQQVYNDGLCTIYAVETGGSPGGMPYKQLRYKTGPLRYQERTVGINRYYAAMREQERIDLVLRIPRREVSTLDVCIPTDGKQYQIRQVQRAKNVTPPSYDLALEELEEPYEFAGDC